MVLLTTLCDKRRSAMSENREENQRDAHREEQELHTQEATESEEKSANSKN